MDIRIYNTNTARTLVETVPVNPQGGFEEEGEYQIAGVKGTGSQVKVAFVNPAGSMTGRLFPTGQRENSVVVTSSRGGLEPFAVQASLVDAANPFIFVDANTMPSAYWALEPGSQPALEIIEDIRRVGAVLFGLAESEEAAAKTRGTPKIAVVSSPALTIGENLQEKATSDIRVSSFSMGKPHPSLQLTGAVCLGAAVCIDGTVPNRLAGSQSQLASMPTPPRTRTPSPSAFEVCVEQRLKPLEREVCIEHSSGNISVGVSATVSGYGGEVHQCTVSRTARRLFEGNVLFNL
jgi:2-methylaconitate cis-trans-isomerase PrpF